MPTLTPKITLTATLLDCSGNAIGSASQPAYLRIALCNFGNALPAVPGTAMLGNIATWPQDIPYLGTQLTVLLWGNDVIVPTGTYYAISVLDTKKNVIQCGAYYFTGTATVDLSNATPNTMPVPVATSIIEVPYSAILVFNSALSQSQVLTFEIMLTGNVTSSTLTNARPGMIVTFNIIQDGTGGRTFAWPGNVNNAILVDPVAGKRTVQSFSVAGNGTLNPLGNGSYN
jgi:hypothetical protein